MIHANPNRPMHFIAGPPSQDRAALPSWPIVASHRVDKEVAGKLERPSGHFLAIGLEPLDSGDLPPLVVLALPGKKPFGIDALPLNL